MAAVFVSYKREDRARVAPIVHVIEEAGLSVWWDQGLRAGERFDAAIAHELQTARCVLVAWSATSIGSAWVCDEAAVGRDRGVLVPFSLDGTTPPLGFRQLHTPDLSGWRGDPTAPEVRRLVDAVAATAVDGRAPAAPPARATTGSRRRPIAIGILIAAVVVIAIVAFVLTRTSTTYAVDTIALPSNATSMRISPDGRTGYVLHSSTGTISVINLGTKTIIGTISDVGTGALALAVTPDGRTGYVSHYTSTVVRVVDLTTGSAVADIDVGSPQWGVELSPDGRRAYAADRGSGLLSVIDTTSNAVIARVQTSASSTDNPVSVAVTPDGRRAYATNRGSESVAVIDTASNTLLGSVTVQSGPNGVAMSPDGRRAYVTNEGANTISVINVADGAVTTIPVGSAPINAAVTPDGRQVLVVNRGSQTLSVIDTVSGTLLHTVAMGRDLGSVSISGRTAYVTGGNFGVLFTVAV